MYITVSQIWSCAHRKYSVRKAAYGQRRPHCWRARQHRLVHCQLCHLHSYTSAQSTDQSKILREFISLESSNHVLTTLPGQWRFTSLLLLFTNELALLSSTLNSTTMFGSFSLLTYECTLLLRQAWIAFNVMISHLPYLSDEKPASTLVTQIGPLLSSMAVRSDISSMSLDKIIKAEVARHADREASLDRIVDAMGTS